MKKKLKIILYLMMFVVFFMSGCSQINSAEKEKAVNIVKLFFEEVHNRNFTVSFPTKILAQEREV